jgi:hypothetical protein
MRLHAVLALLLVMSCKGSTAPDLDKLLEIIAPHGAQSFDAAAHARGCPEDQPLGEYVALLVTLGRHGDAPGDIHSLEGGCGAFPAAPAPIDPPPDPAYWYCTIDARVSDPAGESPWHYALRLRIRKEGSVPDLDTLACPGTP